MADYRITVWYAPALQRYKWRWEGPNRMTGGRTKIVECSDLYSCGSSQDARLDAELSIRKYFEARQSYSYHYTYPREETDD